MVTASATTTTTLACPPPGAHVGMVMPRGAAAAAAPAPPPAPPASSAAAFAARVDALLAADAAPPPPPDETVRALLRALAALQQQLPLRASARLFSLLARPPLLRALVALLPEHGGGGAGGAGGVGGGVDWDDARRAHPYPFLVSRILAYGSQALRANVLADETLLPRVVASLLPPRDAVTASHIVAVLESFLECSPLQVLAAVEATPSPHPLATAVTGAAVPPPLPTLPPPALPLQAAQLPPPQPLAPVAKHALGHPPSLILRPQAQSPRPPPPPPPPTPPRPPSPSTPQAQSSFLSALISDSLHIPSVCGLLVSLVPPPKAHAPSNSDNAQQQAWRAARLLGDAGLMPALATVFARSSASVLQNRVAVSPPAPQAAYDDARRMNGAAAVLAGVVDRLLPVLRQLPAAVASGIPAEAAEAAAAADACVVLNVYETPAAAAALAVMIDEGVQTLKSSNFTCTDAYYAAVDCVASVLDSLVADRERRTQPSVFVAAGSPPPPLLCPALDAVLVPRLAKLVDVLVDTAPPGRGFEACRIRTLDLFVAAQRACAPAVLYPALERVRFGEVAFRLVRIHKSNSILHSIVAASVQTALLSDAATPESQHHWLLRARLVDKIMTAWARDGGILNWTDPVTAQMSPYLSTIIHMACCVQHLRAMHPAVVSSLVPQESLVAFTAFCDGPLTTILADETRPLGGARPPRRRPDRLFPSAGSSPFGASPAPAQLRRTSGGPSTVSNSGARPASALTHSPSAHRFGYAAPSPAPSTPPHGNRLGSVFAAQSSLSDVDLNEPPSPPTTAPVAGASPSESSADASQVGAGAGAGTSTGADVGEGTVLSLAQRGPRPRSTRSSALRGGLRATSSFRGGGADDSGDGDGSGSDGDDFGAMLAAASATLPATTTSALSS